MKLLVLALYVSKAVGNAKFEVAPLNHQQKGVGPGIYLER